MHIPDGYLWPVTSALTYVLMLPMWTAASRIVKKTLKARQVPLLSIGSAFSFVIMMFNIPIPGGTTGHATGAALVAILLGPWAACIAVTIALVIQALLFGDGVILAIGANCFNMAFIEGFVGLSIASLSAAIMFGVQPLFYKTASGQALYCPYGLNVAVPVMLGEHLLVFGWAEAIVTALVVKYLQKHAPEFIAVKNGGVSKKAKKGDVSTFSELSSRKSRNAPFFPKLWVFI